MRSVIFSVVVSWCLALGVCRAENYTLDTSQFVMLDSVGVEAPQRVGTVGTPFGVLIAARPGRPGGLCSATHVTLSLVITAFHCLKNGFEPRDYHILYYDRSGRKVARSANQVLFKGDSIVDIAVFDFGDSLRDWDVLKGTPKPLGTRQLSQAENYVTAWSFTPLHVFPEYERRYPGKSGAVFTPNQCRAARHMPHLEMQKKDPATGKMAKVGVVSLGKSDRIDETRHLFLDQCRYRVVQGNSGSLVTSSDNLSDHFGILHLFVGDKDALWGELEKLNEAHGPLDFYFVGAGDTKQRISWGYGDFFIGSAALLDASAELKAFLSR